MPPSPSTPSMSSASLPSRYSQNIVYTPAERRRQWLINRGLRSPKSGPTRRLANLLPRSSLRLSDPESVHLHVDQNAVPLVIPRSQKLTHDHPSAARTFSLPIQDTTRVHLTHFSRNPASRWFSRSLNNPSSPSSSRLNSTYATRPVSHPSSRSPFRSRRLRFRFSKRKLQYPMLQTNAHHSENLATTALRRTASIDVCYPNPIQSNTQPPDRHVLDRKGSELFSPQPTPRRNLSLKLSPESPRAVANRTVYTVVDRQFPRHVLKPDAHYEQSSWDEYRSRIDKLAADENFMQYLTAPVHLKPLAIASTNNARVQAHQLAANKLYPLAFIKLLEAHAKMAADSSEASDPAEEKHRYDDLDRNDEACIERMASTSLYDMNRFRTVVTTKEKSFSVSSPPFRVGDDVRLLKSNIDSRSNSSNSSFFSRVTQDNHFIPQLVHSSR